MKIHKNIKIKIIEVVITSFLLLTMMPLSVLAEEETTIESNVETVDTESFEEIESETTVELESTDEINDTEELEDIDEIEEIEEIEVTEETDEIEPTEDINEIESTEYIDEPESDEETTIEIIEKITDETTEEIIEENFEEDIEESTPSDIYDIIEEIATDSELDELIEELPTTIDSLIGTWTIDGVTSYRFDIDNQGAMILPTLTFSFKYTLDQDKINIIFDNDKISDVTFTFSINNDTLILEREEELGTSVFTLFRTEF